MVLSKESKEQEGSVMEATTVESVTLAIIEGSLGTLDSKSLSETTAYLEEEPEVLAGEKRTEEEDGVASEEKTEALKILMTLMEELLFTGHLTGPTEGPIGQELVKADILDGRFDSCW